MTFQAYIDNIHSKTGKSPEDFRDLAKKRGLLAPGVKAGAIVDWLKEDFDLGRGHAMAIFALFKKHGWLAPPGRKASKASETGKRSKR